MTTPLRVRLCGLVALLTLLPAPALPGVPQTAQQPVAETLHGVRMVDPYRWLEGNDQGEITEEVAAWTELQNAHTRDVLDRLPGREALEKRLRQLM